MHIIPSSTSLINTVFCECDDLITLAWKESLRAHALSRQVFDILLSAVWATMDSGNRDRVIVWDAVPDATQLPAGHPNSSLSEVSMEAGWSGLIP